jgi:hypothetical protein
MILNDYCRGVNIQIRRAECILWTEPGSSSKNQGVKLGMTWKLKVARVAFVLAVMVGLAIAVGANFLDNSWDQLF